MRHLTYVAVLAGCLLGALWLEPALRVGVLRQWRRLLITIAVVVVAFGGWDIAAIAAGQWWYDRSQMLPITLPGRLPLDELLFFIVVPLCAILGFEAVRKVLGDRSRLARPGLRRSDGGAARQTSTGRRPTSASPGADDDRGEA